MNSFHTAQRATIGDFVHTPEGEKVGMMNDFEDGVISTQRKRVLSSNNTAWGIPGGHPFGSPPGSPDRTRDLFDTSHLRVPVTTHDNSYTGMPTFSPMPAVSSNSPPRNNSELWREFTHGMLTFSPMTAVLLNSPPRNIKQFTRGMLQDSVIPPTPYTLPPVNISQELPTIPQGLPIFTGLPKLTPSPMAFPESQPVSNADKTLNTSVSYVKK